MGAAVSATFDPKHASQCDALPFQRAVAALKASGAACGSEVVHDVAGLDLTAPLGAVLKDFATSTQVLLARNLIEVVKKGADGDKLSKAVVECILTDSEAFVSFRSAGCNCCRMGERDTYIPLLGIRAVSIGLDNETGSQDGSVKLWVEEPGVYSGKNKPPVKLVWLQDLRVDSFVYRLRVAMAMGRAALPQGVEPVVWQGPRDILERKLEGVTPALIGHDGGFLQTLKAYMARTLGRRGVDSREIMPGPNHKQGIAVGGLILQVESLNVPLETTMPAIIGALRFNRAYVGVHFGTTTPSVEQLGAVFAANTALREVVMNPIPASWDTNQWQALARALVANQSPKFASWSMCGGPLPAQRMGDGGLLSFLPGLARIFYGAVPPKYIDVRDNDLTAVSLSKLVELLSGNWGGFRAAATNRKKPAIWIGGMAALILSGNDLGDVMGDLCDLLSNLSGLQVLGAAHANLSGPAVEAMLEALVKGKVPLKELNLASNPLAGLSAEVLIRFINETPTLTKLVLSSTSVDAETLAGLLNGLAEARPGLLVDLSGCELALDPEQLGEPTPDGQGVGQILLRTAHAPTPQAAASVIDYVTRCSTLVRLDISDLEEAFYAPVIKVMADALSRDQGPKHLVWQRTAASASATGMGGAMRHIFRALARNTRLQSFDFTGQQCGDMAFALFGEAMRKNRTLREVHFDGNGALHEGLKSFRGCLYGNKKLHTISYPKADLQFYVAQSKAEIDEGIRTRQIHLERLRAAARAGDYGRKGRERQLLIEATRGFKRKQREVAKVKKVLGEIAEAETRNQQVKQEKDAATQARLKAKMHQAKVQAFARKQEKILSKLGDKSSKLYKKQRMRRAGRSGRSGSRSYWHHPHHNDFDHDEWDSSHEDWMNDNPDFCDFGGFGGFGGIFGGGGHVADWLQEHVSDAVEDVEGFVEDDCLSIVEDATDGMDTAFDHLAQGPDFFHPENLASFEGFLWDQGVDAASELAGLLSDSHSLAENIAGTAARFGEDAEGMVGDIASSHEGLFSGMKDAFRDAKEDVMEVVDEAADMADDAADVIGDAAEDAVDGIAEAVDMYGACPQDLPDGGNAGGGCGPAVLSGCRSRPSKLYLAKPETHDKPRTFASQAQTSGFSLVKELEDAVVRKITQDAAAQFPVHEYDICQGWKKLTVESSNSARPEEASVTLVTQCSIDRLPKLERLALAWGGDVSVALYINTSLPDDVLSQQGAAYEFANAMQAHINNGKAGNITISLLYGVEQKDELHDASGFGTKALYPINTLRNVALLSATAELVFLVDVDFVPSRGLRDEIMTNQTIGSTCSDGGVVVVPAFELRLGPNDGANKLSRLPTSKGDLKPLYQSGKASAFHVQHFSKGHAPSDYSQWWAAASHSPYMVEFQEYFEPYVIMAARHVPLYDERFRGYGMNKISHLNAVAEQLARNTKGAAQFLVMPGHFVIAEEHEKSDSWEQAFGDSKDPLRKFMLRALYGLSRESIKRGETAPVSSTTKALADAKLAKETAARQAKTAKVETKTRCSKWTQALQEKGHGSVFADSVSVLKTSLGASGSLVGTGPL